jgi:hypothetical protein
MAVKKYNGTNWEVEAGSQGITYSATAPTTPAIGDIWVSTTDIDTFDSLVPTSNRNAIINGGFDIWQRGVTLTSPTGGAYAADRWRGGGSGGNVGTFTFTRTALGVTDLPLTEAGLTYYAKHAQTVAPTGLHSIDQRIENVRTFAGKTVTLSFYARLNSGTLPLSVSVLQSLGTGGSGSPVTVTPTIKNSAGATVTTATSSWARYTATFIVPSLSGMTVGTAGDDYLQVGFSQPASGTWNFDITGIQLEQGSVATAFENRHVATELALCQRYFLAITFSVTSTLGAGHVQSGVTNRYSIPTPVSMRPASTINSTFSALQSLGVGSNQALTISAGYTSSNSIILEGTVPTAQTAPLVLFAGAGTLNVNAEL